MSTQGTKKLKVLPFDPSSRGASSVRSPGLSVDEEEDGSRGRPPRGRPRKSQSTNDTRKDTPTHKRKPLKVKSKPLKVKDCLHQMMKFVKKHDLKRILGEHLTKKELKQQLLPQARIAANLPTNENISYLNRELVMNLAILSLYDLVVLIDDSTSMEFEEAGKRKDAIKHVLNIITDIYGAVSNKERGIWAIRFFNGRDDLHADNIQTREQIDKLIDNHQFEGLTRIGSSLMQKILKPFVFDDSVQWNKASKPVRKLKKLKRPLLIMVITDGAVEGEPPSRLKQAIQSVADSLKDADFDPLVAKAIAFQFARVGNDRNAEKFLEHLQNKSSVKDYVDTLSGGDLMQIPRMGAKDQELMIKLLLGPICTRYKKIGSGEGKSKPSQVDADFDSANDFYDFYDDDDDDDDGDDDDEEEEEEESDLDDSSDEDNSLDSDYVDVGKAF